MLGNGTDSERLWFAIHKTSAVLERRASALISKELNISVALFMMLSVIDAHSGPINQQRIAERNGVTKGTVSRLIESGVDRGLISVHASETSRREHIAELTEAGKALVRQGDKVLRASQLSTYAAAFPEAVRAATTTILAFLDSIENPEAWERSSGA